MTDKKVKDIVLIDCFSNNPSGGHLNLMDTFKSEYLRLQAEGWTAIGAPFAMSLGNADFILPTQAFVKYEGETE